MKQRAFPVIILLAALLLADCGTSTVEESNHQRTATFAEIENVVQARASKNAAFEAATLGLQLRIGGQARSGEDSRARLDLAPEATTVRLGPNTQFSMEELNDDPQDPYTRLELAAGQLWIILTGGVLEVDTQIGTASVRGSMMGVSYDPTIQFMTATCLEGDCTLKNSAGQTELSDGQASDISGPGQPPSPARDISTYEFKDWYYNNPELGGHDQPRPNFTYELVNQCETPRHFLITGENGSAEYVIESGQTVTGELPPGEYLLTIWEESQPEYTLEFPLTGDSSRTVTCSGP